MNVPPVMQYQHYNGGLVSLSKVVEKMLIFVLMGKTHYFYLSLQLPS